METTKLGDLEKRLYRPKEDFSERKEDFSDILGKTHQQPPPPSDLPPKTISPMPSSKPRRWRKKLLWVGMTLFLLTAAGGVYATFFRAEVFPRRDVVVTLTLPESVRGGEEVTLEATIQNKTVLALNDVKLALTFPEGTVRNSERTLTETQPIGTIEAGSERKETFKLRVLGSKDAVKTFAARMSYRPGAISSRFENTAEVSTTIASTPFAFSIESPKEAFPGSTAQYTLTYENTSGVTFQDAVVMVEYPKDFTFSGATPPPAANGSGYWKIGALQGNSKGSLTIRGTFRESDIDQEMQALLGILVDGEFVPYAEVASITKIVEPYLAIEPTVNGQAQYTAHAGERMSYHAIWRNTGPVPLRDVVISAHLNGAVFDRSTLILQKGVYDGLTDTIQWTSRDIPELALLAPRASGTADFTINLIRSILVSGTDDREFTAAVQWTIESKSVPAGLHLGTIAQSATITSRVASELEINAFGMYGEVAAPINNTGPIPPRVNEKTTYTIHWKIKNLTNPIDEAVVKAVLGAGVTFTGQTAMLNGNGNIRYDSRTGEVFWEMGRVEAGTGFTGAPWEAVFQVAITPSVVQQNNSPLLISESTFSATDAFTSGKIQARAPSISTNLENDPRVGRDGGRVQ